MPKYVTVEEQQAAGVRGLETVGGKLRTRRIVHRLPELARLTIADQFAGRRVLVEYDRLRDGNVDTLAGVVMSVAWAPGIGSGQAVIVIALDASERARPRAYTLATIRSIREL